MTEDELQGSVSSAVRCDECGAPAAAACVDVLEVENWVTGFMEHEVAGELRHGCERHPVDSRVVGRTVKMGGAS